MQEISRSLSDILSQEPEPVLKESRDTEAAVLRSREPGGVSAAERAALAVRIALLGENRPLADRFIDELLTLDPSADLLDTRAALGRRTHACSCSATTPTRLRRAPRDAAPRNIRVLQAAGISDADIVRLSELIAFVDYQLRVDAGLRLLSQAK